MVEMVGGHMPLARNIAVVVTLLAGARLQAADPEVQVDFNRDIRPILSTHCFQCHGPDAGKRQGELRLDTRARAMAPRKGHRLSLIHI